MNNLFHKSVYKVFEKKNVKKLIWQMKGNIKIQKTNL